MSIFSGLKANSIKIGLNLVTIAIFQSSCNSIPDEEAETNYVYVNQKPFNALNPLDPQSIKSYLLLVKHSSTGVRNGTATLVNKENNCISLVSNKHVTKSAKNIQLSLADTQIYFDANVLFESEKADYSIIKSCNIPNHLYHKLQVPKFCDTDQIDVGDPIYVAGYPTIDGNDFKMNEGTYFGDSQKGVAFQKLAQSVNFDAQSILPEGEVEVNVVGNYSLLHTAREEKGMSGGATINKEGCVVGINGRHSPIWTVNTDYHIEADQRVSTETEAKILDQFDWSIKVSNFECGFETLAQNPRKEIEVSSRGAVWLTSDSYFPCSF